MSTPPVAETPHQALDLCLKEFQAYCDVKVDQVVVFDMHEKAFPKFEKHEKDWPKKRDKVILAARCLGKLTALIAVSDPQGTPGQASRHHVEQALEIVSQICNSRKAPETHRLDWCPEL